MNRRRTAGPARGSRWARVLRWFVAASATAGLATGGIYGWQCLKDSPRLSVQNIEVSGLQRATRADVLAHTGVQAGDSILAAPLDAISLRLRAHPWIRQTTIRRVLPDTLRIDVEEYEPTLLVSLGELYLADGEGHVFKRFEASDGLDLPVVTGIERDVVARDSGAAAGILRDATALVAAAGRNLGHLEELHIDDVLGWSLVTVYDEAPLLVHLGRDGAPRVNVAAAALRRLRGAGQHPTVLWADHPTQPGRVQVRFGDDTTDREMQEVSSVSQIGHGGAGRGQFSRVGINNHREGEVEHGSTQ